LFGVSTVGADLLPISSSEAAGDDFNGKSAFPDCGDSKFTVGSSSDAIIFADGFVTVDFALFETFDVTDVFDAFEVFVFVMVD
jgi:hypothetical protein